MGFRNCRICCNSNNNRWIKDIGQRFNHNCRIKKTSYTTLYGEDKEMNNLLCIFFGHIDNKKLVAPDTIEVIFYGTILANVKQCKRCKNCFFHPIHSMETVRKEN